MSFPSISRRTGLTLVEVLIALSMSLIVLLAMMSAFKFASNQIASGRAAIEMSNQLRTAESLLRSDLEGVTVDTRPWMQTATPTGYFELVEGVGRDSVTRAPGVVVNSTDTYLGDIDDVLAFTARTTGTPFRGQYLGTTVESSVAEIIWFTVHNDRDGDDIVDFDESVDLCRRVLLIRPDLAPIDPVANPNAWRQNDVSFRLEGGQLVPNSLNDLARRENRFCHDVTVFPHRLLRAGVANALETARASDLNGDFSGEDIVLTNVAAFDVRVFSPDTQVDVVLGGLVTVEPGDPGFVGGGSNLGAFVDLGTGTGLFSGPPTIASGLAAFSASELTYDTWSPHYDYGSQATDGIDNDGINGVDDMGERTTMPPYLVPLRGVQVTMRVVEKVTREVRQATVVHSFVPE